MHESVSLTANLQKRLNGGRQVGTLPDDGPRVLTESLTKQAEELVGVPRVPVEPGMVLPLHRFLPDEPLDDVLLRYNLLDETDYVLRHAMFKVARGRKQQCFAKVIVSHVAQ